jgi:type IV pilus assembly protein PilZ
VAENRKHPRKPHDTAVTFEVEGAPRAQGECRDISLGGMFILAASPPPYGAKVRVFFTLPDLKEGIGIEVAVDSIVRWTKPEGMGVQFGVMGARETHALTTLLGPL